MTLRNSSDILYMHAADTNDTIYSMRDSCAWIAVIDSALRWDFCGEVVVFGEILDRFMLVFTDNLLVLLNNVWKMKAKPSFSLV